MIIIIIIIIISFLPAGFAYTEHPGLGPGCIAHSVGPLFFLSLIEFNDYWLLRVVLTNVFPLHSSSPVLKQPVLPGNLIYVHARQNKTLFHKLLVIITLTYCKKSVKVNMTFAGVFLPDRHYRSMPTHGIGRYKYLLPKETVSDQEYLINE